MINTNYHSIGLIIWRSLVSSLQSEGLPSVNKSQAQAGPRFYYSDLRAIVGRCFSFFTKRIRQKKKRPTGAFATKLQKPFRLFLLSLPQKAGFNKGFALILLILYFSQLSSFCPLLDCQAYIFYKLIQF